MAHFPNETPHAIAIRNAAKDSEDKGALYVERPTAGRVIITVRAPREAHESAISISVEDFRKIFAPHLQ